MAIVLQTPLSATTLSDYKLSPKTFVEEDSYEGKLRRFRDSRSLAQGKLLHAHVLENGSEKGRFLGNLLMEMYSACGSIEYAAIAFDHIHRRNAFSWNAIIGAYARNEHSLEVFLLFQQMLVEDVVADKYTFGIILTACSNLSALSEGKRIHACVISCGLKSDVIVDTGIINMYGKCGTLEDALRVFSGMKERDAVSWNAMIGAYNLNGHSKEAFEVFHNMAQEGMMPDIVTFLSLFDVCSRLGAVADGKWLHSFILSGRFKSTMQLENALINMYGKCEAPVDAEKTFYNMQEHNIISWNTMIAAYGQSCDASAALECFQLMQLEDLVPDKVSFINLLHACCNVLNLGNGKRIHAYILKSRGHLMDLTVGTSLVNMYGKCSSLENAWRVFQKIALKNVVAWNTMMAVYAQNGHAQETFTLFQQMQLEDVKPDRISFVSIFDACAKSGSLVKARLMHAQAIAGGFITDVIIENAIVHMYGQCSCPEDALDAFQRIINKDTISWNAIIGALGQNGYGMETFTLFQQIQLGDAVPDRITYITMFDICSTLAALSSGKYMHSMVICSGLKYDVVIGTALVSMYGKCASVEYAYRLFSQLSDRNVVLWNAMLSVYTQTGYDIDALDLFECMPLEEAVPDTATFASVLGACANLAALTRGKELHAYIKGTCFEYDLVVMNAFLNMYGKCGSTEIAKSTFSKMLERDIISWNAMIAAHGQNGFVDEAFGLFQSMQIDGIFPVDLTFISILSACSHAGLVAEGCHNFISMSQHHDITQVSKHYNCIVDLLGRAGWLDEAQDLIDIVVDPGGDVYLTLLGASKVHGDMIKAYNAAKQVFLLDPENVGAHVSLSNIYAAYGL